MFSYVLGSLPSDFTSALPSMIGSSAVKSLSEMFWLLHNIFRDAHQNQTTEGEFEE